MELRDYHTHNGYSGCASKAPYSAEEGWKTIQKRGVSAYGISNHFPTRKEYGNYLPKLREEVDGLENPNIMLGVELELNEESGNNKLAQEQQNLLDYIVGSAHQQPVRFLDLPDITEDEIEMFWNSYHKVLSNGFKNIPVDIWGHPFLQELQHFGDKYWKTHMLPIYEDLLEICANRKIAVELTPAYQRKCQKQPTTFSVLEEMYKMATKNKDIYFATSSDAHDLSNLGILDIPLQYVKRHKIPEDRLVRIEKK